MPNWFLSYHSPEEAVASDLRAAIESKDVATRVFFAPANLRAGGLWSAQLAAEIAKADAFILLIGARGVGRWQLLEYDEALDRWANSPGAFPLVVVLLQGQSAPGLPFLRRLHWIVTSDPASDRTVARLADATVGHDGSAGQLWRYTSPYRGLEAMEEADSDYFLGRSRETTEVLRALVAPGRLPVLIGNSGVGKSSLAKAGVLAALKRQAWPDSADDDAPKHWPQTFASSRQWCFLTLKPGTEPLKALTDAFLDIWQFAASDPERVKHQLGWIELLRNGNTRLSDLIDATVRRRKELDQPTPPAFLLYVDQGEELYVRADEQQRRRFSELLAQALDDPRVRIMMSLRADFLGLLQSDQALYEARQQIDVPPLRESALRDVVAQPAEALGAHFESNGLVGIMTRRAAEDSIKDVGALPLLSYTLDDMWTEMVKRGDGLLRLPAQSFELGGVLVDRASAFVAKHPDDETALRRILTLRCATVREGEEPTRRRASREEFSDTEWRLVSELADYPNRLLVTVSTTTGTTYAEVAHEAIFRRWDKLREWIAAEREFLAWRSTLEGARKAWIDSSADSRDDALLMGAPLSKAATWLSKCRDDLLDTDQAFIDASIAREQRVRRGASRLKLAAYGGLIIIICGLVGIIEQAWLIKTFHRWRVERYAATEFEPHVLTDAQERKHAVNAERYPRVVQAFRECREDCPEMVVVPSGSFLMGSEREDGTEEAYETELPKHKVVIAKPFAVGRFDVTFREWEACVGSGACSEVKDSGFGKERLQPVINVTWRDAQGYVKWLSKMTHREYRLLSEAEWEYAARAGTTGKYYWGDEVGKNNANCKGCGSVWDQKQPSPGGSFAANKFGLYDMAGNVWQWVEDCYHPDYGTDGRPKAPADGTSWVTGDCKDRVLRGGSTEHGPRLLRPANRGINAPANLSRYYLSFRVARTLSP